MKDYEHNATDIYNKLTERSVESDIALIWESLGKLGFQLDSLLNPVTYAETSPAEQPPPGEGLSTGALREALISAMDLGGAYGANLSGTKDVVIQVGEQFWSLGQVAVSFRAGRFVLLLKAHTTPEG
jgi:hypothetical protein